MIQMVLGPLKIWAGWCTQGREFTTFDFRRVSPKLMLQIRLTWNNFLGKPVNNLKICKNIMVLYTCVHGKCTWSISCSHASIVQIGPLEILFTKLRGGSRKRYWDCTKRGGFYHSLGSNCFGPLLRIALLRTQRSSASSKEDPWSSNQHSSKLVIQRTRKDYQCGVCKTFPLFQNQSMRRVVLFLVPFFLNLLQWSFFLSVLEKAVM